MGGWTQCDWLKRGGVASLAARAPRWLEESRGEGWAAEMGKNGGRGVTSWLLLLPELELSCHWHHQPGRLEPPLPSH